MLATTSAWQFSVGFSLRAGFGRFDNHWAAGEQRGEELIQEAVLQAVQEVDISDSRSVAREHMRHLQADRETYNEQLEECCPFNTDGLLYLSGDSVTHLLPIVWVSAEVLGGADSVLWDHCAFVRTQQLYMQLVDGLVQLTLLIPDKMTDNQRFMAYQEITIKYVLNFIKGCSEVDRWQHQTCMNAAKPRIKELLKNTFTGL